jgi:uncharacterized protein YjiS (DUF1127 family)
MNVLATFTIASRDIHLQETIMTELTSSYHHPRYTIFDLIAQLRATMAVWQQRVRERHYLAQMNWREVADMGVPHSAIEAEIAKPMWRA